MNIDLYRSQINEIDLQLLELLNQRAILAHKIGKEKQTQGLPVLVPEREKKVLSRLAQLNNGPLKDEALRSVFQSIIEICRNVQYE